MKNKNVRLNFKINPGAWWLIFAIATDVLSTFYSAKGNGLVNKTAQGIALVLYIGSLHVQLLL